MHSFPHSKHLIGIVVMVQNGSNLYYSFIYTFGLVPSSGRDRMYATISFPFARAHNLDAIFPFHGETEFGAYARVECVLSCNAFFRLFDDRMGTHIRYPFAPGFCTRQEEHYYLFLFVCYLYQLTQTLGNTVLMSSCRYVFTLNNPTEADYQAIIHFANYHPWCEYLCFGHENAPETGTYHLQGYLELRSRKSIVRLSKFLPRLHFAAAKGTAAQCITYSSKDSEWEEYGERPSFTNPAASASTARACVAREATLLARDGRLEEVFVRYPTYYASHYPYLKAQAGLSKTKDPIHYDLIECLYIHGPPGTGKTWSATHDYGLYWIKDKPSGPWWDGYEYQPTIIIDEMDRDHVRYYKDYLRAIGNGLAVTVKVHYGHLVIKPQRLIVTSNYSLDYNFGSDPVLLGAIKRRFKVIHMDTKWEPPITEEDLDCSFIPLSPAVDSPPHST